MSNPVLYVLLAACLLALAALDRHDELQPINSTHATGATYAGSLP